MHILILLLIAGYFIYKFGRRALRTIMTLIGIFVLWKSGLLIAIARILGSFVSISILKLKELIGL
jgi:predicted membrane protein